MPREFTRSDRVAAQIQRELADLLRTEVRDGELGMVTVSDVEATRDLSLAKAYVSFLGAKLEPKACIKRLNEAVPMLRHALGKRMRLRVLPELRFVHDESIVRGQRMDALLAGLSHEGDKADEAE
ncbi:30S ribosome-binding factor RbfA [Methylococcus sp. EFPC2]|uniref:30S ribosome-binding factor RbfA n=1 Tax=Methylococcus sp. EFPC2 TaxID=2812648 RepID=UPI0019688D52|nr:30S ribosome-binding factor RbfA [Methylococcus sp. EFPC2]QSA97594.1 30S ribosome-binding factor RbfA [Methylococcus sp. EFPC2]